MLSWIPFREVHEGTPTGMLLTVLMVFNPFSTFSGLHLYFPVKTSFVDWLSWGFLWRSMQRSHSFTNHYLFSLSNIQATLRQLGRYTAKCCRTLRWFMVHFLLSFLWYLIFFFPDKLLPFLFPWACSFPPPLPLLTHIFKFLTVATAFLTQVLPLRLDILLLCV